MANNGPSPTRLFLLNQPFMYMSNLSVGCMLLSCVWMQDCCNCRLIDFGRHWTLPMELSVQAYFWSTAWFYLFCTVCAPLPHKIKNCSDKTVIFILTLCHHLDSFQALQGDHWQSKPVAYFAAVAKWRGFLFISFLFGQNIRQNLWRTMHCHGLSPAQCAGQSLMVGI
jgi:hypothetical protein